MRNQTRRSHQNLLVSMAVMRLRARWRSPHVLLQRGMRRLQLIPGRRGAAACSCAAWACSCSSAAWVACS